MAMAAPECALARWWTPWTDAWMASSWSHWHCSWMWRRRCLLTGWSRQSSRSAWRRDRKSTGRSGLLLGICCLLLHLLREVVSRVLVERLGHLRRHRHELGRHLESSDIHQVLVVIVGRVHLRLLALQERGVFLRLRDGRRGRRLSGRQQRNQVGAVARVKARLGQRVHNLGVLRHER